jgi:hypothetical protein
VARAMNIAAGLNGRPVRLDAAIAAA